MKSIQAKQYGGEEQLELVDVPRPEPGPQQVMVRVAATSFNAIDPKRGSGVMRQIMPLQFPHTPGGDFSGTVEAVGAEVKNFQSGDEVFGYSMLGGAYAEFIATDANNVTLKPKIVGHVEAASLALVAQTARQMLERVGAKSGQTILIHGASGAIGGVTIQIAHKLGVKVIAVASAQAFDRLKQYGADQLIDSTSKFEDKAKNIDAVLDTVGGDVQQRSYSVLKPGGALVAITQPPSAEEAAKHNVQASFLVTAVSTASLDVVAKAVDSGEIKPLVGQVRPLADVAQAWREIKAARPQGKVVFTIGME